MAKASANTAPPPNAPAAVHARAAAETPLTGFENARFDLREIPLAKIRLGKYSLRDVDRNGEEYLRLRDAIAATGGPYLPILVREIADPEKPEEKAFGLVDGLQRYSCCSDLGFKVIPARVIYIEDAKVAMAQIIANRSRIETKPVEYTQQLRRMFMADPTLTLEELADQLHCSVKWLNDRLSLAKLHPDLGKLVDDGNIPLAHAFALAKLQPKEEQLAFAEQAQTQGIQEFSGHVGNRAKALRDAARAGRENVDKSWKPVAHIRPVRELKEQLEAPTLAETVCKEVGADTPEAGFHAALKWVFNLDPSTVEILRQKAIDDEKKTAEDKRRLAAEKAQKKADAARAAALGVSVDQLEKSPSTTATMVNDEGDEEEPDEDEDEE
jgi:ParB/RepB/Spo0J family partition protein